MRIRELIAERFNQIQPLRWADLSNEDVFLVQANFQVGDGEFIVQFKRPYYNNLFDISFARNGKFDLTATGSAQTVLATVGQAIREFIASYDPRMFAFSAKNEEKSRNRLYPKLAMLIQREFPQYAFELRRNSRYTHYDFERPAKPIPEPEPVEPVEELDPISDEEMEAALDDLVAEIEAERAARRSA